MFEYKSDVAILHGSVLSALEQLKRDEKEKTPFRIDLCRLSDKEVIKVCQIIVKAVKQLENEQHLLTPLEINDTRRRLHACIFHSLLSFDGHVNTDDIYFEAIENIFPCFDWKLYCNLLNFAQWQEYFVEIATCLEEDLCVIVLNSVLDYIQESDSIELFHCIQEIIIKKYFTGQSPDVVDRYQSVLKEACETFTLVWEKHVNEVDSVTKLADMFLGPLVSLRTMCEFLLERFLNDSRTGLSDGLAWCRFVTDEVYLVVTQVDELLKVLGNVEHFFEESNLARVLRAILSSLDSLELFLFCSERSETCCDSEDMEKLKMICRCLRNVLDADPNQTSDSHEEIMKKLQKLDELKKFIFTKGIDFRDRSAGETPFGEMYELVEEETLCKLMNCCLLSNEGNQLHLIETMLSRCDSLPLARQQNVLWKRLETIGLSDVLKIPHFDRALTTCLNQASTDRKIDFRKILKLSLQSPEETMKRIVLQAVANSGQIDILIQMLMFLHPVCSFNPGGDSTLLVIFLDEILKSDLAEKQFQNVLITVKNLLSLEEERAPLNSLDFVKHCVLPNFNNTTSSQLLGILLRILQHICGLPTASRWIEGIFPSAVAICLCQLIDLSIYNGDGNQKEQIIKTLAAFKDACHKVSGRCKGISLSSLSAIGKFHALEFFGCEYAETELPLLVGSEFGLDRAEKMFSDVKPRNRYPLLVAVFVQTLPHATFEEWTISCTFALKILSDKSVLEGLLCDWGDEMPVYNPESFLTRCITDTLILIFERRQAPISWTYVLYCYSMMLKSVTVDEPECKRNVLCEACRLSCSVSVEIASLLVIPLLELVRSVSIDQILRTVIGAIPHQKIRTSLFEVSSSNAQ